MKKIIIVTIDANYDQNFRVCWFQTLNPRRNGLKHVPTSFQLVGLQYASFKQDFLLPTKKWRFSFVLLK